VLAAVVEEADVVVLLLERPDLRLDEGVELVERAGQRGGDLEVQAAPPKRPGRRPPASGDTALRRRARCARAPAPRRGAPDRAAGARSPVGRAAGRARRAPRARAAAGSSRRRSGRRARTGRRARARAARRAARAAPGAG